MPGAIAPNPRLGITPGLGPSREGVPFISISGGFTIGNDFEGELPQKGNTYQISDSLTKLIGKHTAKFGIDYRYQRFFQTLYFDPNGDYSYFGGGANDPIALDSHRSARSGWPSRTSSCCSPTWRRTARRRLQALQQRRSF